MKYKNPRAIPTAMADVKFIATIKCGMLPRAKSTEQGLLKVTLVQFAIPILVNIGNVYLY